MPRGQVVQADVTSSSSSVLLYSRFATFWVEGAGEKQTFELAKVRLTTGYAHKDYQWLQYEWRYWQHTNLPPNAI